jgi:thioredoxin-like negative regulator of GroEL
VQVTALPTVIAFRQGKPVDKFMGFRDAAFVRGFLDRAKAGASTGTGAA